MSSGVLSGNTKAAEVVQIVRAPASDRLTGFCLDRPVADFGLDGYTVQLAGWVIGRERRVKEVAVFCDGTELRRTAVDLERPDVAAVHGAGGTRSGFDTAVGLAALPRESRIRIDACFEDEADETLAEVVFRRSVLDSGFSPTLQPLLVTSLFRMGTTRVMRLLSEHPDIVVERSYPYETSVASYWLQAFKILTEPANLHESSHPNEFVLQQRWIGHNPFYRQPITASPAVARWMGRDSIEDVAAFCQRSTERFYRTVAADQDRGAARYFAEKYLPDGHVPDTLHELYTGAREVFLVRDFRDVICSMNAFNKKRGYPSFGRQKVGTEEEMIELFADRCRRLARAWQRRAATAHLIHYEDLVRDPAGTVTALLRHCDLDASGSTVTALLERADRETPEMAFHRTTASPVRSIGRWRDELPAAMAAHAGDLLRDSLRVFGYEPTGAPIVFS